MKIKKIAQDFNEKQDQQRQMIDEKISLICSKIKDEKKLEKLIFLKTLFIYTIEMLDLFIKILNQNNEMTLENFLNLMFEKIEWEKIDIKIQQLEMSEWEESGLLEAIIYEKDYDYVLNIMKRKA